MILTVILPMGCIITLAAYAHHRLTRFVPRNRTRAMRFRLHLAMRAGRGMATTAEIFLRFSRFAMWRTSRQVRPSLSSWDRFCHPDEHSMQLGKAQRRLPIRVSRESHKLYLAGPRTGKTQAAGVQLIRHPGCAIVTSSKADLMTATAALRAKVGPIEILNPAGFGDIASTIHFNPIAGATDPAVAIRRADAFASAVSMKGSDNGDYFAAKCSSYLRALFMAAALVNGDMRIVARWVFGSAEQAEHILESAGHGQWANELGELRGAAEKSAATTKSLMTRALQFMNTPQLAEAVLPGDWNIEQFIRARGTIYLVADSASEENPMAPLYSCVATEILHTAGVMGSKMPGGRLDPSCLLLGDELANVCPLPLPNILSDAGGRGIEVVTIAHGFSALANRWGERGAQTILDTSSAKIFLRGITDTQTLDAVSKMVGQMAQRERGQDHHVRHDILTPAMIRGLPQGYAIVVSGGEAPVIVRLDQLRREHDYKRARRSGELLAVFQHVGSRPVPAVQVPDRSAVEAFDQAPDPLRSLLDDPSTVPAANAWGA